MEVKTAIKSSELGPIPIDWDVLSIEEVAQIKNGLTYSPLNVSKYGTLVLRSANIQKNKLSFTDNVYVNCYVPDKNKVKEGDILICVRNGSRDLIGKCALIDKRAKGEAFGAFMAVLRSDISDYLIWQFRSSVMIKQINEHLGATINQITNSSLKSFKIIMPSSATERQAIADVLSDIDALIISLEKLIEKKDHIFSGFKTDLFKQVRENSNYEMVELGKILSYEQPTKYIVEDSQIKKSGKVPVLTANKAFILGYTDEISGIKSELPIIIFDDFTTDKKFVDFKFKVRSSAMKLLSARSTETNIYYVFCAMEQIKFPVMDHKRYWISEYQKIKIPLPKINEQKRVASILLNFESEIKSLKSKLRKVQKIKEGMLQELLTGKTRLI